jgi:ectoine hydroxylase-related dioxygenase (phytanoyl-CoA dioxygenase family)
MSSLLSRAWLGPGYQVTSQVNVVNPGGASQVAHRDYHLGVQSSAAVEQYPSHVHRLSPGLTLQGAVAHCEGRRRLLQPALFRAAGANPSSNIRRMANLLQVSSAFGRAMATVDRQAMCLAVYPALVRISDEHARRNVIAACADGYAFPTNLDRDPPVDGPWRRSFAGHAVDELAGDVQVADVARVLLEQVEQDAAERRSRRGVAEPPADP